MSIKKRTLKRLKRKIKEFWCDEKGGEGLTTLLYMAITLLIIAVILVFALDYFTVAKEKADKLWSSLESDAKSNIYTFPKLAQNLINISIFKILLNFRLILPLIYLCCF